MTICLIFIGTRMPDPLRPQFLLRVGEKPLPSIGNACLIFKEPD